MQRFKLLLEVLWGQEHPDSKNYYRQGTKRLQQVGVQKIIDEARAQSQGQPAEVAVTKALHYFEHNVSAHAVRHLP